ATFDVIPTEIHTQGTPSDWPVHGRGGTRPRPLPGSGSRARPERTTSRLSGVRLFLSSRARGRGAAGAIQRPLLYRRRRPGVPAGVVQDPLRFGAGGGRGRGVEPASLDRLFELVLVEERRLASGLEPDVEEEVGRLPGVAVQEADGR